VCSCPAARTGTYCQDFVSSGSSDTTVIVLCTRPCSLRAAASEQCRSRACCLVAWGMYQRSCCPWRPWPSASPCCWWSL
jgi:hypothetical protein